jgi:hypothetical protein
VLDISGSGMSIRSPWPVPAGVPLQIQGSNRVMIGEAVRCEVHGHDDYRIGILVHSVLQKRIPEKT